MHNRLTPLALLLLLPFAAVAQTTPPTTTLQVQTQLVLLDVSVTDKAGHPVLDLRPDEFKITERGVPQSLKSFERPSSHMLPSADAGKLLVNSTADLPKIGQAPVTLIVVDELNMNFQDRAYMRTKLIEWIKRQPAVLPQPTALLAVTTKEFHVLRDYTQDRDTLLQTMQKHTGDVVWRVDGSLGSQAQENTLSTLGALEQVAQATRGIPGRKNVLWVGDGFPSVRMGDIGRVLSDRIEDALRRLSGQMLKSRMTLDIIGGLDDPMPTKIVESDNDKDMEDMSGDTGVTLQTGSLQFNTLAPATGGHVYTGRNDLDAEIGQAVDNGGSFYSLSYRPSDASDDPKIYRRIKVTVTRPGLLVQTRDGYFKEPPEPSTPAPPSTQQLAFDLMGAGMSTLAYTDLHVKVQKIRDGEYELHADPRDITWHDLENGNRHADLVLLAVCISQRGRMMSRTFATLGSNTEETLASIGNATTTLPMKVAMPMNTARIRFVVRDMGSGRVGTVDYTP